MAAIALQKHMSSIVRSESQNYALIRGLESWSCVGRQENNIHLILPLHQSSGVTKYVGNKQ